jgi:hypothetical protein
MTKLPFLSRNFLINYFALGLQCNVIIVHSLWSSIGKKYLNLIKADTVIKVIEFLEGMGWIPSITWKNFHPLKISTNSIHYHFWDLTSIPFHPVDIGSSPSNRYGFVFKVKEREIQLQFPTSSGDGTFGNQRLDFPFYGQRLIRYISDPLHQHLVLDWQNLLKVLLKRDQIGGEYHDRRPVPLELVQDFIWKY